MNKALTITGPVLCFLWVQLPSWAAPTAPRIPVIDVTDLDHPHQDAGDDFDLTYLSRLQKTITQTHSNLTTLTESADRAAHEFLIGAKLWAAGRQADFIAEACGRAGGLMAMAPLGRLAPTNHDVVLYAVPGLLDDGDRTLLKQWQEQGTTVIAFSSSAGVFEQHFPVDTVTNIIELWTWTGEFVAACTRLGRMPVLYQSLTLTQAGGSPMAASQCRDMIFRFFPPAAWFRRPCSGPSPRSGQESRRDGICHLAGRFRRALKAIDPT